MTTCQMDLISRDELQEKISRGDSFKLVMTLSERAFRSKRIPGSIGIDRVALVPALLDPTDEIVVYCSADLSPASKFAYHLLKENGYNKVRRYAGGVSDWEEHGLPLEGAWAHAAS